LVALASDPALQDFLLADPPLTSEPSDVELEAVMVSFFRIKKGRNPPDFGEDGGLDQ
jgi:hypothetical protein